MYRWDKILQVNLRIRWVQDTLKWEPGKARSMNSGWCSVQRTSEIENYVWCRRFWRSESQRRMPQRSTNGRSSFQAMLIPDVKATMEWKEWKEVIKEGAQQKKRKVHFVALMDICHIQKHKYIRENVRKSNLMCGSYQALVKELYTNFQRRSMKQDLGQKITSGTLVNEVVEGSQQWHFEKDWKHILQCKYHHWIFLELLMWILISREFWITLHHCVKRKKTSIIWVANLHRLPWNITSMAHKIRTTSKRRWIFKRAPGNRCLHDAGKTRPPRKWQRRRQQSCVNTYEDKVQLKKSVFQKDRIWTMIPRWYV